MVCFGVGRGVGLPASVSVRGGLNVRDWMRLNLWMPSVRPRRVLIVLVSNLPPMDIGQSSGEESVSLLLLKSPGLCPGLPPVGSDLARWGCYGEIVVALANGPIWLGEWWRKDGA